MIVIQIHQEAPADNSDLGVLNDSLNSQSFKYKAALVGKNIRLC